MSRWQAWLIHATTIVLTATATIYVWLHYYHKPSDPFRVISSPWEPFALDLHILVAPLLILAIGIILHSHIFWKLEIRSRTGKKTGIILIPLFCLMVASGYILQIITTHRPGWVMIHLASGALWAILYGGHQIASYSVRKAARQNQRSENPVL